MSDTNTDRSDAPYPARLEIDYPERVSRVKTLFRIILVIPILALAALVTGSLIGVEYSEEDGQRPH